MGISLLMRKIDSVGVNTLRCNATTLRCKQKRGIMRKVRAKKLRKAAQLAAARQLVQPDHEKNFYRYLKKQWTQNSGFEQKK